MKPILTVYLLLDNMLYVVRKYRKTVICLCSIFITLVFLLGSQYSVINETIIGKLNKAFNGTVLRLNISTPVPSTIPVRQPFSRPVQTRSHPHPLPLEPDNWQIVIPNVVFVYSAHLDPWSKEESVIHILGSTLKNELTSPKRTDLYCKIWIDGDEDNAPSVCETNPASINQLEQGKKYT